MMPRAGVLISVVMVLSGCAAPPPRTAPQMTLQPPESWLGTNASADSLSVQWWTQFSDTHLDSLIEEALVHNHDLRAAVARIDAARARARLVGAAGMPQVSAGVSGSAAQNSLIGFPLPPGTSSTSRSDQVGVSLNTSWEVDVWGRIRSGQSAAMADAQAVWADAHAIRLSLAGQTAKTWFAVLEARAQVELAETTLLTFDNSTARVRERFEGGVRTPLDLRLALSNQAAAGALLEQRRVQLDRHVRQLQILLGRYPSGSHGGTNSLPTLQGEIAAATPLELLERRPDLVAAERRLAAAGARVSEARRAFLPRLSLSGGMGKQGGSPGDLFRADSFVWNVLGNLMQPIFQGGRLRASLALAQAGNEQLLEQYASTILYAWFEVESSYAAERLLLLEMRAMEQAAQHAVAAQDLAEDQYSNGLIDYITLLESQRRALDFQSRLLDVRRRRLETRVNLMLALGGGFHTAEEIEVIAEERNP
jgi:NodT family efflux transporter outer membrane factor (OMF) lipoprotein